jgi:hypothetical protein
MSVFEKFSKNRRMRSEDQSILTSLLSELAQGPETVLSPTDRPPFGRTSSMCWSEGVWSSQEAM